MPTPLRQRGQVTIPAEAREAAHLEEGDLLDFEIRSDGILLKPLKLIDATQEWFWQPECQAKEREADEDIAAGRVRRFSSNEEFLASLEEF
jgi:AbrB family looped-hinge helix DNA binding protein